MCDQEKLTFKKVQGTCAPCPNCQLHPECEQSQCTQEHTLYVHYISSHDHLHRV